MDTTQLLALTVAGLVLPFVQERLVGAHIEGPAARWVNFVACLAVAVAATAVTGGFAGASTADPVAFGAFLLGKAAGVNALAQLVYGQFENAVHVVGNTSS